MNRTRTYCKWARGLVLVGVALGCDKIETSPSRMAREHGEGGAVLVRVTPIQPGRKTLVRWIEQSGQIGALEETPLYAKVAGYVEKMHADIGDAVAGPQLDSEGKLVREGQLLIELDVPELHEDFQQKRALVGQAQAEVKQALAAIKVAKSAAASARAKVDEAEALIDQTQADYEFAQSEFTRMKELAKRGAATGEVAEEKGKQFRAADAKRKQTQARVDSARAVLAESQSLIEKAEADQKAAEARLDVAQADAARVKSLIGYTRIRAPYDGVVTARNVHAGHLVQPGTAGGGNPLLVVAPTRVMRIFVDVPDTDAALVAVGAEAQVTVPASPSQTHTGTVKRTDWKPDDSSSRTLRIEIDVPNDDGKLLPGIFANIRLRIAERTGALSLPKSAVLMGDGKTYCLTIDAENRVVQTSIETGIRAGDDVEVVSGLNGDEQVIAADAAAFHAGQQVEVVEPTKP
jgi:HlyD family secretion protein